MKFRDRAHFEEELAKSLQKTNSGISVKYHGVNEVDHPEEEEAHHNYEVLHNGHTIANASAHVDDHSIGMSPYESKHTNTMKQHCGEIKNKIKEHLKSNNIKPWNAHTPNNTAH